MAKDQSGNQHGTVTTVKAGVSSTRLVDKVIIDGKLTTDSTDPKSGVVQ